MSGIDRTDQMLSYHSVLNKTLQWYQNADIHFFEKFLVNAFYLYNRFKVLSSGNVDIKSFHHEVSPALVGPQLPDPKHQEITTNTEKKQIQQNHVVYVQKVKPKRNLDISAKNVKIILLYV